MNGVITRSCGMRRDSPSSLIGCLHNVVALSMLDESALMRRKKVLILILNFDVLEIFSPK